MTQVILVRRLGKGFIPSPLMYSIKAKLYCFVYLCFEIHIKSKRKEYYILKEKKMILHAPYSQC